MTSARKIGRVRFALAAILCLLAAAGEQAARADGGVPCWSGAAGGYEMTIFVAPNPPRIGPVELSVLVQDAATRALATDARIAVRLTCRDRPQLALSAELTAEVPSNRLLRGATVELTASGPWLVEINVTGSQQAGGARFEIEVAQAMPRWRAFWPWFSWPVVVIGLYAAHRLLVARSRRNPSPSRERVG